MKLNAVQSSVTVGDCVLATWYDFERILFAVRVIQVGVEGRLLVEPLAGQGQMWINRGRVRSAWAEVRP